MRKLLIIMLFSFLFISVGFSQTVLSDTIVNTYPEFVIDSLGHKCVIITLEQARYIDTKLEILVLMKDYNITAAGLDSVCLQVINDQKLIIIEQALQTSKLEESNGKKDSLMKIYSTKIDLFVEKESTYISEISNKNDEIDLHTDRITKLETKLLIGGIGSGLVIATVVVLLLTK